MVARDGGAACWLITDELGFQKMRLERLIIGPEVVVSAVFFICVESLAGKVRFFCVGSSRADGVLVMCP